MPEIKTVRRLVAALLLCGALPAHAEKYRVDLIVFADRTGAGEEAPLPYRAPDLSRAIDPADAAKLRSAGIELVPDDQFGLLEHWRRLANSQRHQPLIRIAWVQKDPPGERGPALRLRSGAALTAAGQAGPIYPVDGSVTLLLGRFLHLDANLAHSHLDRNGEPRSYTLEERRRMRRKELHHLDSPRLGVLARVEKVAEAKK